MSAQTLDRVLTAYRLGDPAGAHRIFDAAGSKLWPGRWNTADSPMIYTSEHYSTAMLEKLAHGNGHMPPNQHWIEITIPPGVSYEVLSTAHHPGWDAEDCLVAKAYGRAWQQSKLSLLLVVPSVVARMERNVLINGGHPEVGRITHGLHQPIWWDGRLFSGGRCLA
ncbi:MAG: RES domain-containing protein [Acetobacteraceae bacterium]|nr:RES domain-containing protein [Acetobacteraceae bacterium]